MSTTTTSNINVTTEGASIASTIDLYSASSTTKPQVASTSNLTTTDVTTTASTTPNGLTPGEIAGISVGAILGVSVIIAIVFLLVKFVRRKKGNNQNRSLPSKEELQHSESVSLQGDRDRPYSPEISMQTSHSNVADTAVIPQGSSHSRRRDISDVNIPVIQKQPPVSNNKPKTDPKKDYVNQQVIDALQRISEGEAKDEDFLTLGEIEDIYENTDIRSHLQECVTDFDASKKYQNRDIIEMLRRTNDDYQNKDMITDMTRRTKPALQPPDEMHTRNENNEVKRNTEQESYENMTFSSTN